MKQIYFLLFGLLFASQLDAQYVLYKYPDDESKPAVRIECRFKTDSCMYVGGSAWDIYKQNPFVTCFDSTGQVKWHASIADSTSQGVWVLAVLPVDSFVYCFVGGYNLYRQICKLNAFDGTIVWEAPAPFSYTTDPKIFDFDSNHIIVGSVDEYAFIDKTTGVVTEFFNYNQTSTSITLIDVDDSGYVYLGLYDSLTKFDRIVHDSIIWTANFSAFPASVGDPVYIYCDGSSVYYMDGYGFKLVELSSTDGSIISVSNEAIVPGDLLVSEIINRNGFFYVSMRHEFVGSIISGNTYLKYNKSTDSIEWAKSLPVDPLSIGPPQGNNIGCMGIDVDNAGDVYGTGYYNSSNYAPGTWFTFKANGTNGSIVWQKTIIDDSTKYDISSTGITAWVKNNSVYFLGLYNSDVSCGASEAIGALAECDQSTGQVQNIVFDGGTIKFISKVIRQELLPGGDVISFMQRGRGLEVIRYDNNMNIVWSKKLYTKHYNIEMFIAGQMAVATNGSIAISAVMIDYYDYTHSHVGDSIMLFTIDASGNLMQRTSFPTNGNYFPLQDLVYDGTYAYTIYLANNTFVCQSYFNGIVGSSFQFDMSYIGFSHRLADDISPTEFVYCSTYNGTPCLNVYNKFSGTTTVDSLPGFPMDIEYVGNNRVMLCGSGHYAWVALYDLNLHDTVWTYNDSTINSWMDLVHVDITNNAVYAGLVYGTTTFYKLNFQTGQFQWRSDFQIEQPDWQTKINEIVYDPYNQRMIGVGATLVDSVRLPAIWIYDDSGNFIDTIMGMRSRTDLIPYNISGNSRSSTRVVTFYDFSSEATTVVVPNSQMAIVGAGKINDPLCEGIVYSLPPSAIVSIPEEKNISNISAYPNPFHEGFTIDIKNESTRIYIYDIHGRMIKSFINNSGQNKLFISMQEFPDGLYLIRMADREKEVKGKILKM